MARDYRKLEVYNLGYALVLKMYKLTEKFPEHEKNNLIDQIRRSVTSIPLNLAEGTSRFTKNSFLQFVQYAYGSIRELQVLLELSKDLNYISLDEYNVINEDVDKLSAKLFRFIKTINKGGFFDWFEKTGVRKVL